MNYKTYHLENYDIHFVKTDKFKTVEVKIYFQDKVNKHQITYRNCLTDYMTFASNNYSTKRNLTLKTYDLYSLYLSSSNVRFGTNVITKFDFSFLNPKYTEPRMLKESLDFVKEIIYNPLVVDNKFDEENLTFIKQELEAEVLTLKEQPRLYANVRLLEETDKDMPYANDGYSDLEILKQVNGNSLYQFYKEFLANNKVDILVVGDVCEKDYLDYFKENFTFSVNDKKYPEIVEHPKYRKRIRKVIENSKYTQSKVAIAFKLMGLTRYEYRYVINVFNSVFGGGGSNLLMQTVRENNGLVYYINSFLCKTDNLIVLNTGIDSTKYDKIIILIKKALHNIELGNFDESLIENGKYEYLSSITETLDSISGLGDLVFGKILFDSDDIEVRKQQIMSVTKEDVMNVAKKVKMDTVYLLKGGLDD